MFGDTKVLNDTIPYYQYIQSWSLGNSGILHLWTSSVIFTKHVTLQNHSKHGEKLYQNGSLQLCTALLILSASVLSFSVLCRNCHLSLAHRKLFCHVSRNHTETAACVCPLGVCTLFTVHLVIWRCRNGWAINILRGYKYKFLSSTDPWWPRVIRLYPHGALVSKW